MRFLLRRNSFQIKQFWVLLHFENCQLWRRRAAVYCLVLQRVAHPTYAVCTDLTPRRAVGGRATVSFFAAAILGSHNVVRTQTTRTGCVRPDQSKSRPVVGGSCQSVESWNFILELLTLYLATPITSFVLNHLETERLRTTRAEPIKPDKRFWFISLSVIPRFGFWTV